jgi:hypothetical protein
MQAGIWRSELVQGLSVSTYVHVAYTIAYHQIRLPIILYASSLCRTFEEHRDIKSVLILR